MKKKLLKMCENIKRLDNKIKPFAILIIIEYIVIIFGMIGVIISLFDDFTINSIFGIILVVVMLAIECNILNSIYNELINKN